MNEDNKTAHVFPFLHLLNTGMVARSSAHYRTWIKTTVLTSPSMQIALEDRMYENNFAEKRRFPASHVGFQKLKLNLPALFGSQKNRSC